MNGYQFSLSCPNCACEVEHVTGSHSQLAITTEATAIAQCTTCQRRWLVLVHLRPALDEASIARREYRKRAASAAKGEGN